MISRFLSPTVQGELSRQPRCQPPCSTLGYLIQSTSLFGRPFCLHWTIPQDPSATPKVRWIIQLALGYLDLLPCTEPVGSLTMRVCLQATRRGGRNHVVLSAATTILQRWKVKAEVCTREAEPYCVQLAVPPATAIAPSRPADSTQQSGQAPHRSSPTLNGNLLPRPRQVFDL